MVQRILVTLAYNINGIVGADHGCPKRKGASAVEEDVNAAIAIAHARHEDLPDPSFQFCRIGAAGFVAGARAAEPQGPHALRIETAQSAHIPRASSRVRSSFRAFAG